MLKKAAAWAKPTLGDAWRDVLAEARMPDAASLAVSQARQRFPTLQAFAAKTAPALLWHRHVEVLAQVLEDVESGKHKRVMIWIPPRHGKALAVDTPIPTPDGWRRMDELRPGDSVFAGDGSVTRVRAVSPIWRDRDVYAVTTKEGHAPIIADAAHEWPVRLCRKHKVVQKHETAWLAARKSPRRPLVHQHSGLALTEDVALPIGPYTLGAWLGDGNNRVAFITCHEDDQPHLRGRIESEGYGTRQHTDTKNVGVLGLISQLRAAGLLRNKHIPAAYLRASTVQRLALLQALIDTDGYVAPDGQVEFCATHKRLAEDVRALVTTFGVKAAMIEGRATLDGRDCGAKYRVMFYMAGAASLPRKAARCKDGTKQPGHYLRFAYAGKADTLCIEVEHPSHTFLAGEGMIPTCNSELVSRTFTAWYLLRNPGKWVGLASYGAKLAQQLSRIARDRYTFAGGAFRDDSQAVELWQTPHGGGMWAAGVGGSITGFGADLALIDDPLKGDEEAGSPTIREKQQDWYQSVLATRLHPGAAVVVVQTRWHEDDLSGWLLRMEAEGETREHWHVVHLPALRDDWDDTVPPSCTMHADWRDAGEALAPAMYGPAVLEQTKRRVGPYVWAALYQGRPQALEGGLFRRDWWGTYEPAALPRSWDLLVQSWDLAFKDTDTSDYVAGVTLGVKDGRAYVLDCVRGRYDFPSTVAAIRHAAAKWPTCTARYVEDKANGPAVISTLRGSVGALVAVNPQGGKLARAHAIAPLVAEGKVLLPPREAAPWVDALVAELTSFPTGAHDDQVDALTQGLRVLAPVLRAYQAPAAPPPEAKDRHLGIMNDGRTGKPRPVSVRDLAQRPQFGGAEGRWWSEWGKGTG
jgi:predicted phage terminase large subunit-like protein